MRKNKLNHNRAIMMGVMAMSMVVLIVVVIFWMWCFPAGTSPNEPAEELPEGWEVLLQEDNLSAADTVRVNERSDTLR